MKRPIPFLKQKRIAHSAIGDVFSNTNVLRSATKVALIELKDAIDGYLNALNDDESAGVKDESQLK